MKKDLRWKEFSRTLTQIAEISSHIAGNDYPGNFGYLTQINLDGHRAHLQYLHNEKAVRLQKVNSYISAVHELSEIMSFDFSEALSNVHESLTGFSKSISDDTLTRLTELVESRKKEKHQRLLQVKERRTLVIKKSLNVFEEFRKLFASCYSLPKIEERMTATYGAPTVVGTKQFFETIVKATGGDEKGDDAYKRHSIERSRQRRESRDKEESE